MLIKAMVCLKINSVCDSVLGVYLSSVYYFHMEFYTFVKL